MLSCKQAAMLLSQAQDRGLGFYERSKLRLHLILCDACTNFMKQLRFIRRAMHAYRDRDTS